VREFTPPRRTRALAKEGLAKLLLVVGVGHNAPRVQLFLNAPRVIEQTSARLGRRRRNRTCRASMLFLDQLGFAALLQLYATLRVALDHAF
jgi:hypothetical protein